MFHSEDEPPRASREEDLPGFTHRRLRVPSISRLFFIVLFFIVIIPTEGCLPSWFRQEKPPPAALNGEETTAEVWTKAIRTELTQGGRYEHPAVDGQDEYEVEYVEEEEEEDSGLAGAYNTPSPIEHDPEVEEYRRAYGERECDGWCFSGGNCTVHVHPKTFAYLGKECRCPPNFMGARCEEHYVKTLYSSIKGQANDRRIISKVNSSSPLPTDLPKTLVDFARIRLNLSMSSVPALSLFFFLVIVAVGIAVLSYRRITKRHEAARFSSWRSSPSLISDCHLRRTGGIRAPFSTRMPPRSETLRGAAPLLLEGGHFVLPQTAIGQDPGTKTVHGVKMPAKEPPPVLLPRKNTHPTSL